LAWTKILWGLLFGLSLTTIAILFRDAGERPGLPPVASAESIAGTCDGADCVAQVQASERPSADRLVARYVPVVSLPDLDQPCRSGGSSFAPIPVESVLNNPSVLLKRAENDSAILQGPSASDLLKFGGKSYFSTYLDFPGDPEHPGCRYERDALRFSAEGAQVAYARVAPGDDDEGLVVQYWFFYYFNDWNNKHEGDWEFVELYFDATSARQALNLSPEKIRVSQHSTAEVKLWTDAAVEKNGTHPVVYVARGSHANYFRPGLYLGRGEEGRGFGCDDASESGRRVQLEARLLPDQIDGPNDPYAWLAYKGYWGDISSRASEGSTALVTKQNWLHPFVGHGRINSSSVALPTDSFLGQDAARAFCNAVSFGSNTVLPFYHSMPALSLVAFAMSSLGLVASLASTPYLPVSARPQRRRRRLGQIFLNAIEVYCRKLFLFLTVGLLAFPAGLAATAALPLDGSLNPLNLLTMLPYLHISSRVAAFLAFGGLHVGASAVLVTAATTALLAGLRRDDAALRRQEGRAVWRLVLEAVVCRAISVIVIGALSLTVVGIPFAVRQAVRWAFLEQVILIEQRPWRDAFAASAAIATRSPIWVGTCLAMLGLIAMLAAPAVGISLIVAFRTVSPAYLNLIASLLYAALVPYLAIVLTLIYFDLDLDGDRRRLEDAP
jgi:hypothetical protein